MVNEKRPARRSISRVYMPDDLSCLPWCRVFMKGPKWKRHFAIQTVVVEPKIGDRPLQQRKFLIYDPAPDVRELVLEELRHDVYAMWSDPRERILS